MTEIPEFLRGIDPDTIRDLEEHMNAELDHQLEQEATVMESNRRGYLNMLAHKMELIDRYFQGHSVEIKMRISMADEMARSHFIYYVDKIFAGSEMINKPVRLAEALAMADVTQEKVNREQTGQLWINEMGEWRARIAEALLADDPDKQKQEIIDLYDRQIRDVVLRFLDRS